jgi:hypothetical protein
LNRGLRSKKNYYFYRTGYVCNPFLILFTQNFLSTSTA